ncbi:hypothetical protein J1614_001364 [Plenodomus biglobosus]|nr:hypothetical protein J1614_001364 [Plenodomus biglobosus]
MQLKAINFTNDLLSNKRIELTNGDPCLTIHVKVNFPPALQRLLSRLALNYPVSRPFHKYLHSTSAPCSNSTNEARVSYDRSSWALSHSNIRLDSKMLRKDEFGRTEDSGFKFYVRSWYRTVFASLPADIVGYPQNGNQETNEKHRLRFNEQFPERTFEDRLWELLPEATSEFRKLQSGDNSSDTGTTVTAEKHTDKSKTNTVTTMDIKEATARNTDETPDNLRTPLTIAGGDGMRTWGKRKASSEAVSEVLKTRIAPLKAITRRHLGGMAATDDGDPNPDQGKDAMCHEAGSVVYLPHNSNGKCSKGEQMANKAIADHKSRCPNAMADGAQVGADGRIIGWGPDPESVFQQLRRFRDSGSKIGTIRFNSPLLAEEDEEKIPDDWLSSHDLRFRENAHAKRAEAQARLEAEKEGREYIKPKQEPTAQAKYYARFGERILGYDGPLGSE